MSTKNLKQKVVTSPVLELHKYMVRDGFLDEHEADFSFVCVTKMCCEMDIDFPKARRYELQASLTQWQDSSGSPIWVRLNTEMPQSWMKAGRRKATGYVYLTCAYRLLRELGVKQNKSTRIFVRLRCWD